MCQFNYNIAKTFYKTLVRKKLELPGKQANKANNYC